MGPRARICAEHLVGAIVTNILTVLKQKVVSSENPTAPWVIILVENIEEFLTPGLKFAGIFEARPFPSEA